MKQGNSLVTLVIVLLAVMLAAYLGVYAWDSFTDPFTTTLTYSYTANDSLEADGWVVREEQLLPAQSGILDITRAEGEEVGRGQTVALVHQNSQALDVQAQMEELAMEIELLDYAMNQTDDVVSAARLDESILQSLASLRFASASGSYRQLDDDVMELKSQVLKRSYTYGEGLDSSQLSALRQSLIEEYRALRTQSSSVTSRITAPAAGVFSSLADGYESLLTPQSILTMTPADLDALAGQQVTAPSGTAGKLITSDRWYFAAAVSEEEALRLSKESSVTARFSGSFSQDVPMTLEQVGEAVDGRAVVVLSSNRYLSQIPCSAARQWSSSSAAAPACASPRPLCAWSPRSPPIRRPARPSRPTWWGSIPWWAAGQNSSRWRSSPRSPTSMWSPPPPRDGPSCGRGTRSSSGPPGSMTGNC